MASGACPEMRYASTRKHETIFRIKPLLPGIPGFISRPEARRAHQTDASHKAWALGRVASSEKDDSHDVCSAARACSPLRFVLTPHASPLQSADEA